MNIIMNVFVTRRNDIVTWGNETTSLWYAFIVVENIQFSKLYIMKIFVKEYKDASCTWTYARMHTYAHLCYLGPSNWISRVYWWYLLSTSTWKQYLDIIDLSLIHNSNGDYQVQRFRYN